MTDAARLATLMAERYERQRKRKIESYFPDAGPLRRDLYAKHVEAFAAGTENRSRAVIAANRVGKTESIGGYELAMHLTGDYPRWWPGRRFDSPISAWAAGDTGKTTRDILQQKLLGPRGDIGTGLIPGAKILHKTPKQGISDGVELVYVEHESGGTSTLTLKSYDQKREAFQGTEQDFILLDEEPPESIYTECMMRTMATGSFAGGMVMMTFTPLMGMTQLVQRLIEGRDDDATGSAWTTSITWDDVPHLSEAEKIEMLAAMPPHQRDARSKGVPQLGAGAVWPVPESEFVVAPFAIPAHWPRAYALDVGWNRSAVVWAAWDREHDIVYLYDEHYMGEAEASQHAAAIRARGAWMSGVIDPGARGRSQVDGRSLIDLYRDLGLRLSPADNAVETGLHSVWLRLTSGRLKVFSSMRNWLSEFRLYRRDEKGRIVKERDHLMDATRYVIASGLSVARVGRSGGVVEGLL